MAEPLEIRIFDLIPELLAHAFILGQLLKPAGTVSTCAFQALFYIIYNLFVRVFCNMHSLFLLEVPCLRHPLLKLRHLAGYFLYLVPQNEDAVCLLCLAGDNILGQ